MKFKLEQISTAVIWTIVIITTILYVKYFYYLKSFYELIVALAPPIIFFTGGILIFSRDRKKTKRAKEKEEFTKTVELNWGQELKHDLLTYLVPVLILAVPFFFGELPTLINVFEAIIAFLALTYLKIMYWGEM